MPAITWTISPAGAVSDTNLAPAMVGSVSRHHESSVFEGS